MLLLHTQPTHSVRPTPPRGTAAWQCLHRIIPWHGGERGPVTDVGVWRPGREGQSHSGGPGPHCGCPEAQISSPIFLFFKGQASRTASRDHQPPTANSQRPAAANCQPTTATKRQPPTATNCPQPPTTTNRHSLPLGQPPTANRRETPIIVQHCLCGPVCCPCRDREAESIPKNVRFCWRCESFVFPLKDSPEPHPHEGLWEAPQARRLTLVGACLGGGWAGLRPGASWPQSTAVLRRRLWRGSGPPRAGREKNCSAGGGGGTRKPIFPTPPPPSLAAVTGGGGSGRGCPTCHAGGGGGSTQPLWLKMIPTSR